MQLHSIKDLDFKGKKVFIRCDFNVPMDEYGNITDDRRIRSAIATINYCLDQDCAIILASHLGRPKGESSEKYSLAPVQRRLHQLLHSEVALAKDVVGEDALKKVADMKCCDVLLLENLRFEKGEEKNSEALSKALADMADFYINDAFGVSHRAHASVEGITHHFDTEHKAAGFLLQKEIKFFGELVKRPVRPFISVVGGSKLYAKLEALENHSAKSQQDDLTAAERHLPFLKHRVMMSETLWSKMILLKMLYILWLKRKSLESNFIFLWMLSQHRHFQLIP